MPTYVKKAVTVLILLGCLESAYAVDGNSLLIGISIGLGMYAYQGTRNHPATETMKRYVSTDPKVIAQQSAAMKAMGIKGLIADPGR